MKVQSFSTRCSIAKFLKLCRKLQDDKLQGIRDLQFKVLLSIQCHELRHNLCLWLIQHFNVGHNQWQANRGDNNYRWGLIWQAHMWSKTPRRLHHIQASIWHHLELRETTPLPAYREFQRAFIFYVCATLLAPISRIDECRDLWHTIHEDTFNNDVN